MPLKIMTCNLRNPSAPGINSWANRRPVTQQSFLYADADIVGTQEGFYFQIKEIAADLPHYSWIGLGREGGSHGEFMAVFYRTARLELLEYDHFWLSDTPNVIGSITWGHHHRRMVTWVKFRDLLDDREFYLWNTHFDHEVQSAREKAAELVVRKIRELNTTLPLVLTGDFNAYSRDNKAYDILTGNGENGGGLTDLWISAKKHPQPNFASFHNYEPPIPDGPHIDWILGRDVICEEAQVVNFEVNGQYPSDHFPIMATVRLTA